ncbi:hypothetical protein ElyMa_000700700 [Elysia marginata]|uniref:IgGFc-binding protein N-terminal domain-containing protein n=1 Tax=Elysia marginata TaxID=1093978 RepID=A0AAV4GKP3_9GAST|nr:hypothetical protein ElyMa_000700700 [Elysia marginata]
MLGRDYVTFPSLPMDSNLIDYYTVVAVQNNTVVSVYEPTSSTLIREVTLLWPGDLVQLELSASGYHHVNGTHPFYLYAKLTGADPNLSDRRGRCSVTLLHAGLFRETYKLTIVPPLLVEPASVYVVVIVNTSLAGQVEVVSENGTRTKPDNCQSVTGTAWSGCYFLVENDVPGSVYTVQVMSPSSSKFGAYVFVRVPDPDKLLCFQLGLPDLTPSLLTKEYDYSSYYSTLMLRPQCDSTESTTSAASPPPEVTQCPTLIPNATAVTMTTEELEEALEEITQHLTVETSSLSSVRRTKESAPDERASSTSMGYFSLVFICVFLGLLILSDCRKLYVDLRTAVENIRTGR